MSGREKRVVVALSGGVDSALTAYLLCQQGYDVIGLFLRFWSSSASGVLADRGQRNLEDAKNISRQLGISLHVDFEERLFHEKVVSAFVESYQAGETPNPCVFCNTEIKFPLLLAWADQVDAAKVATGHYVRCEGDGRHVRLFRAKDSQRDQSYFLYGLSQRELLRTLFPLGDWTKDDVRTMAGRVGLDVWQKPDSQDICFLSRPYSSFVAKNLKSGEIRTGKIVTEKGEVIGEHDGIHQFTVGQRSGLGLTTLYATYVLEICSNGDIVVGPDEHLFKSTLEIRQPRWILEPPVEGEKILGQIRSRCAATEIEIISKSTSHVQVVFKKPQRAITVGQALVVYRGHEVVGGGIIHRVIE